MIPLLEVVGNADKLAPEQIAATCVNIGVTLAVTVTVTVETPPQLFVNVIVAVPAATPITRPEVLTEAIAELLVLQVPELLLANCVVDPTQTEVFPVMAAGEVLNTEQFPPTVPATQLEVVPVNPKLFNEPVTPLPLASTTVVTPALFVLRLPAFNLKYACKAVCGKESSQFLLLTISPWHNARFQIRTSSILPFIVWP